MSSISKSTVFVVACFAVISWSTTAWGQQCNAVKCRSTVVKKTAGYARMAAKIMTKCNDAVLKENLFEDPEGTSA